MNPAQTHRRPFWRTPKQRAVFIAALVFGAGALLWVLSRGDTFNGDSGLVFIAPLVTALVAGAAWWLMLRLDPQITVWRSAVVGAVIGLAVHPPIWYLEIVFHDWSNTPLQALGDLNLWEALLITPVLTLLTWLFLGWLTVPFGALLGAGIAYFELGILKMPALPDWGAVSDSYARYFPYVRRIVAGIGVVLLVGVSVLLVMACLPVSTAGLEARPNPAPDYAAALARLETMQAQEAQAAWLEVCHSRLLTHGKKTERAIVLLHGYTNCPRQYWELAEQFYARGYNVLLTRTPLHVHQDFDVARLNALTAEQLRDYGDASMDIAAGLGEQVYVLGLSGGGAVAGWIAQYRADAERVMLLAPFFATGYVPGFLNVPLMNLAMHLPPIPLRGKAVLDHAYPGNATRGVGEYLRFAESVRQAALQHAPRARSILLVTNGNDNTVDNAYARAILDTWHAHGAVTEAFEFDKKYKLLHDMIDTGQANQPIEWTYPALIDLIEGRAPTLP